MANLGIIDADPSEPPSDEDVIFLANCLLREFNIPTKIEKVEHISAALFVILYESLFSERLPGIIRQPFTKEDEIHNCQTVIDTLSTEIVHDSLSHIRGVDVVEGNITAISNLLDIFSHLLEYVVNKIESDVATDNEDKESEIAIAPAEGSFGEYSPAMNNKMNGTKPYSNKSNAQKRREAAFSSSASQNKNENRSTVISHEEYCDMIAGSGRLGKSGIADIPPSPIRPDQSESFLGQKTVDSTDFDEKERKSPSNKATKIAWSEKSGRIDPLADLERNRESKDTAKNVSPSQATNGSVQYVVTHHHYHHYDTCSSLYPGLASSMPLSRCTEDHGKSDPLRATVGPIEYNTREVQRKSTDKTSSQKLHEPATVRGLSSSYNDLKELVEKTATMTRVALDSSPVWKRAKDLDIADYEERPRPSISSSSTKRAKELNAQSMKSSKLAPENPNAKTGKRVAFLSSGRDDSRDRSAERDCHRHHTSEEHLRDGGLSPFTSFGYPFTDGNFKSRYKSSEEELDHITGKSQDSNRRNKKEDSSKAFALHLAHHRQPELGAAHMRLHTEDRAVKKKQEVLRRMYDKNMEDFTDDVDILMTKDKQASDEIEQRMFKSYNNNAAKNGRVNKSKSASSVVSWKKPKMSKSLGIKSSHSASHKRPPSSSSLDLKSDEDLLSVLLEEFPHLHLSDHTWHELWRKGLNQIESLTRVYQENKRKKSRAQTQMEEAAERHNLLSNIMNKQLEQTKRLREIKERKTQQVQVRNKAHEKRIQSARARRYYNEYQVRTRGKQLKRRTKEEMVFRELFKDALSIQKERIRDIRQYTADQRKRQESQRQDEIDSLENFYHDQFAMLSEKLDREKKETAVRNASQLQMLDRMKRELRKKMTQEIETYQEQIFRDDDDVYFRQMDADKLKHQLHKACYRSM